VADPRCIITAPMAVARGLTFDDLATALAADALVRRAWAVGRGAELVVPRLAGDLASHHAFERELAKEGHDRTSLPADELDARAVTFEEDRRIAAAERFAGLSVTADLGLASTTVPGVARAARTAFVRLYEEGVIEQADRVVATCPRCRTPLDAGDTERGEVDGERLTIRLGTSSGDDLDLALLEPELLPGAVAVAVPESSPTVGSSVVVPIADREVPVIAALVDAPTPVIAAHDGVAHDLAVTEGLVPVVVLDEDGVVVADGPLAGLSRYAARAAARELLDAEGVLVAVEPAVEEVWRCRCCGTVVVPRLGRHWFLRSGDLEVGAADAVRHDDVTFSPSDARDAFLGLAGLRRDWCLSGRVTGGVPLPSATCVECGKTTVDVDPSSSCGKCMGEVVGDGLTLDARFVAAVWPLVLAGWPGRTRGSDYPPEETLAVVAPADLSGWVLPSLSLALRLAGAAPFAGVVVHPWPEPEEGAEASLAEASDVDRRIVRLALVAGTADLEGAAAAVAALDQPYAEDVDAAEASEAASDGVAALDAGAPAQAAALLTSALSAGVPADAAERVRALALPILGD
jgi:valyl-tRNA synthetase